MIYKPMNMKLIAEYEDVLLGKSEKLPNKYFAKESTPDAKENINDILKYVIEVLLKWTPDEAASYLNNDIISLYKIDVVIKNMEKEIPVGLSNQKYQFILSKLYPNEYHFNVKKAYVETYKQILNETIKTPKHFFTGGSVKERACICLQFYIQNYLVVTSIQDLYKTFGEKNIYALLKKAKLYKVCMALYNNPVEFLHDSLSYDQRDEFLFRYYAFCDLNSEALKKYYKRNPLPKIAHSTILSDKSDNL